MGRFEKSNIDSNFVPENRNGKCIAPVMICPYGDHVHTVGGLKICARKKRGNSSVHSRDT